VGLISKLPYSEGWAAPLLDVGAADDDAEEVDVGDDVVDGWVDDLLLPHPATATPATSMLAPKPAAITDVFITIDSLRCDRD